VNLTLNKARVNKEIITINNSELIRALFRYKGINFDQNEIDDLLILQKTLKKKPNNDSNRKKLLETSEKLDSLLFIEDIVNVEFKNKSHYQAILNHKGFYVNGIRFVPFMATAGMIRRNTAMFINNNIKHPLMDILENGRDESKELVIAKWGAYFSLYCSTSLPVSFPRFAVIPDKEIKTIRKVDFVTYKGIDEDDNVETVKRELSMNAWDGQGLISPNLAKLWSDELELDYTFSNAVIRAPFLKGLVTVFDMNLFANLVAKKYTFTDIYGIERDIRETDLIISESMFKLTNSYENTEEYIENCHKNKLGFSIAKVNPKVEKSYSRTSYQFLQVLNLNDADIARLCEPTINWFRDISGGDADSMLLYATGESKIDILNFNKMDITVKAISLNEDLARDKYIQSRFVSTLEKKKRESYKGSILINANYQFMVSDPYYQACHLFGIDCEPLLKEGEHYSEYWLNKNVSKVAAIRSPIVHHSELNILNFQEREDTRKWYSHIHSGIIFPASGIGMDCAIHGGADFDGDLICTINNPIFEKGRIHGLPIMYESRKAEKSVVDSRNDKEQVESQLNGYNSKVGFATNISSSLYSLLEEFPKGSEERKVILNRLKIGRVIQGEIIDGVKGLKVPPFRNHWTRYKHITEDMTEEEIKKWEFNNKIVCDIRPSFFRFLYPHYMTAYNKELKKYDIYSYLKFNKSFDEIMRSENRTEEEDKLVEDYKEHTYFLDNNSIVNKISRYMRTNLALIGRYSNKSAKEFDYQVLKKGDIEMNLWGITQMKQYLQEYKSFKKALRQDASKINFSNIDQFVSYLRKECYSNISSNEAELANYAVEVTYGGEITMVEFAWKMFPEGLLENIIYNSGDKIALPVKTEDGNIEYLWDKYEMIEFSLETLYEN